MAVAEGEGVLGRGRGMWGKELGPSLSHSTMSSVRMMSSSILAGREWTWLCVDSWER